MPKLSDNSSKNDLSKNPKQPDTSNKYESPAPAAGTAPAPAPAPGSETAPAPPTTPARAIVRNKGLLVSALVLGAFLGAIEGTIVTLAIPTIVRDLAGFDLISLIFSVFLLTAAITTPIYGKIADLFGRKWAFEIGIVIFLIGSVACALAQDMMMLIAARALQGIGSGALFSVPMTIVGDVFNLRERSRVQGLLSAVWGIAGLAGPFAGGLIIDLLSWHWIFLINLPFGAIALLIFNISYREKAAGGKAGFDIAGIITLSVAMTAFLAIFIFTEGEGVASPPVMAGCLAVSALAFVAFYRVERRAHDPLVHFELFDKTNIIINILSFLITATLIGVDVYLPIYLQNVYGLAPTIAGLTLLPMTIAWTTMTFVLGRVILRLGSKRTSLLGAGILLLSLLLLLPFSPQVSPAFIIAVFALQGVGFCLTMTTQTLIIQDSVSFEKRGAAVGLNQLLRSLGQTIGIGIFGSLFNAFIVRGFLASGITRFDLSNLYDMNFYDPWVAWENIVSVLDGSLHVLFIAFAVIVAIALLLTIPLPRVTNTDKKARERRRL